MAYSNSSLNCFANCMAKYNHIYNLHTPPCKPDSPHLLFGTMAHEVLYKAGVLRDETDDGVVDKEQYYDIIPSEVLYNDLKEFFSINSWQEYFTPVIKQVYKYERAIINEMKELKDGPIRIDRELKLQVNSDDLKDIKPIKMSMSIVGVIDLLIRTNTHCTIIDYKFSTTKKTQDDFDMNSQLPLYSLLVHKKYNIPLRNIKYGYIDIPKQSLTRPIVLSNGTISRAKNQNVSQEMYEMAVKILHEDDPYYNCKPGGYYYDAWCNMALNKAAYLSLQYLDLDTYNNVINDLLNAVLMIEFITDNKLPYLHKYDAYTCKSCEYVDSCKPWLYIGGE